MDDQDHRRMIGALRTLDLDPGAGPFEVRQAFRIQSRTWDPEGFQTEARLRSVAEQKSIAIKDAYEWLIRHSDHLRAAREGGRPDDGQGTEPDGTSGGASRRLLEQVRASSLLFINTTLYLGLVGSLTYGIVTYLPFPVVGLTASEAPVDIDPRSRSENEPQDTGRQRRAAPEQGVGSASAGRPQAPSDVEPTDDLPVTSRIPRIGIGSSKYSVTAVLGAPETIERNTSANEEVWRYRSVVLAFSTETNLVVAVRPPTGGEESTAPEEGEEGEERGERDEREERDERRQVAAWTAGSSKDEVARIQGAPTRIERSTASGLEVWHYGESSVSFSMQTGLVVGWDDPNGSLSVSLPGLE